MMKNKPAIHLMGFAAEPKTAIEMGIMQGSPPERLIDISKWDKGPDNRWAFQHISEIIPTAVISRGSGVATTLNRAPQDITGLAFKDHDGKKNNVKEMLDEGYTDGFIVLHNGKVLFEKYYNGMTPHTRHLLMSISKSVTGTLTGQLVTDGRLNPDAKVIDYIPELKNSPGFAEATVQNLLDMTTSLVFNEDYDDPKAHVVAHEETMAWRGRTPLADKGIYAFAQTIKKEKWEHGEQFHYASINADVLGWLIERSCGKRYIDFMSETIWSKLGVEHNAQISVDYKGSVVANGGYCITLRDLARFSQMMLDDGYYNGQQIVPSSWIDDIRFNGNNAPWKTGNLGKFYPDGFYRNQWHNTGDDQGSFFADGVNGQQIWINPTTRVVIVKLASYPVSSHIESTLDAYYGMDAIARKLGEK